MIVTNNSKIKRSRGKEKAGWGEKKTENRRRSKIEQVEVISYDEKRNGKGWILKEIGIRKVEIDKDEGRS